MDNETRIKDADRGGPTGLGWAFRIAAAIGLLALLVFSSTNDGQSIQFPWQKAKVQHIFIQATKEYNAGEYEKAKVLFDQVKAREMELTEDQRKDLAKWIEYNDLALAGRGLYRQDLVLLDKAIKDGKIAQARQLVKGLQANPYGSREQRERLTVLIWQLNSLEFGAALHRAEVHFKSNQAANASFLCKELDANRCATPEQLERLRMLKFLVNGAPPNTMSFRDFMRAAHASFDRKDLDLAEIEANMAMPPLQRPLITWGDTPEALLQKIQDERKRLAHPEQQKEGFSPIQGVKNLIWGREKEPVIKVESDPSRVGPRIDNAPKPKITDWYKVQPPNMPVIEQWPPSSPPPTDQGPPLAPPPPQPLPRSSSAAPADPVPTVRMSNQELPPSPQNPGGIVPVAFTEDPAQADRRRQALGLVKDALDAMEKNDLEAARRSAQFAKELKVSFAGTKLDPDAILAEITRREMAQRPPGAKGPSDPANPAKKGIPGEPPVVRKEDARAAVKQARELINKEKFDEATQLIAAIREAKSSGWGLFEDSPDKLQNDLNKSRTRREREKGKKIMIEARKAFDEGRVVEAKTLAYEARALLGRSYSIWDGGERPQHLIDEIYRLEIKERIDADKRQADPKADKKDAFVSGTTPTPHDRAVKLLTEARILQTQGKLTEARARCVEANNMGAAYADNEDNPSRLMSELAAQCRQMLNYWYQISFDPLRNQNDPDRFARSEKILESALQLCKDFQQDPRPLEQQISKMRQAQGKEPPPQPTYSPIQIEGLKKLDMARKELEAGDLPTAHRMVMAVGSDPRYGVQNEAMQVLRSIESAMTQRAAEATIKDAQSGILAFREQRYKEALGIFAHVNWELLSPQLLSQIRDLMTREAQSGIQSFNTGKHKLAAETFSHLRMDFLPSQLKNHVREIMSTKEMQRGNLENLEPVDTQFGTDNVTGPSMPPGPTGPGPDGSASGPKKKYGSASIDDLQEPRNHIQEVIDNEQLKLSKWRQDSIAKQQTAMELFPTNPEQAIGILEEFLETLREANFQSYEKDALINPLQQRINQFKTIQTRRIWEQRNREEAAKTKNYGKHSLLKESERIAQQREVERQYGDLIAEGAKLQKEKKWYEAKRKYELARELLPDQLAHVVGLKQTQTQIKLLEWNTDRDALEADFLRALRNRSPGPIGDDRPMIPPSKEHMERWRSREDTSSLHGMPKSPSEQVIEAKLRQPISLNFRDAELRQVIATLQSMTGLNIVPDELNLRRAGISLDQRVSLNVDDIHLKSALNLLLHNLQLTYMVKDEALVITTQEASVGNIVRRTYYIGDLTTQIPDNPTSNFNDLLKTFAQHMASTSGAYMGSMPSPMTPTGGVPPGMVVSGPNGYGPGGPGGPGGAAGFGANYRPGAMMGLTDGNNPDLSQQLVSLITDLVAQNTWRGVGGNGDIRYFPQGPALIINQTEEVQEEIANLLAMLRKLQEVQVAIEMRLVTVSDSFYDFVNMNFQIGAVTGNVPKITGVSPAGTTTDLTTPFQNVANQFATPPWAGFRLTDGSIAIGAGVNFLNEIQVQMFMEAARADKRTRIDQAPKLTVLNTKIANITMNNHIFFNTGAIPIQNGAQTLFMPNNIPFPVGTNMQVQPIVSADRRFVRLHLQGTISNLVSTNVPAIPVEIPVPQLGDRTEGRTSFVKMYFQQPQFSNVGIHTTVNVPDGGTVLLGGMKTLTEVRNESGPPILSQLPYFNRLFRNTYYSREAQSLMIMVTPRIIINEEELNYQPTPATALQR